MMTDDEIDGRLEDLERATAQPDDGVPSDAFDEPWYRKDIRESMEHLGIDELELADRANMDPSHVSMVLSGERGAKAEQYFRMACAMDLPVSKAYAWACNQLRIQMERLAADGETGFES